MKDIVTPVPPDEVRSVIKKCLETAALVNYTKLSAQAKAEVSSDSEHKQMGNHYGTVVDGFAYTRTFVERGYLQRTMSRMFLPPAELRIYSIWPSYVQICYSKTTSTTQRYGRMNGGLEVTLVHRRFL